MRVIPRAQLLEALEKFARLGRECEEDELNVDLFRLFDDGELRLQARLIGRFVEDDLPPDPSGFHEGLRRIEPRVSQQWAIVDPYVFVDNDYRDEAPPEELTELAGYTAADGTFVPTPSLSPLPRFCSSMDDACQLKQLAFGPYLLLHWNECQGEWGLEYEATLRTTADEVVAAHRSDQAPHAIVGSILHAMASGWNHDLFCFRVDG